MRLMTATALGAAGLLLAGCVAANMKWVRPGASVADFEADKLRCQYDAELATANRTAGYGIGGAIASGMATGMKKAELMNLCMRTKGWTLEASGEPVPESEGGPMSLR